MNELDRLDTITVPLQIEDISISEVRIFFDTSIVHFRELKQRLAPESDIVQNAAF